jgi:phage gp46-like protein
VSDLLFELTEAGPDLVLSGGDVALGSGLQESVLCSLFSDGRATTEEIAAERESDPRGWWAEDDGDRYGSKLWLLSHGKLTVETLRKIEDYSRQALAWMRDRDIVEAVECKAEILRGTPGVLGITIELRRGRARLWPHLWSEIASGAASESTVGDARVRLLFR